MQIVYNQTNINLNYLNNYVKFFLDKNSLYLYNTIYEKKVTLTSPNKNLKEFLIATHKGSNNNELIEILKKISNNPEELYEYLLQNFIIE